MGVPARLWLTMLAVAAATALYAGVAAAADRFVPRDASFVVAEVGNARLDERLQRLLDAWRAQPEAESAVLALAEEYVTRARAAREPRYFGRAEALLGPRVRDGAGADLRRLYAQTLQFRHDFDAANRLLEELLRENPHDGQSRLLRASLRLTRGDFPGARADCASLTAGRSELAASAIACLSLALAGTGELTRARALLDASFTGSESLGSGPMAYLLTARAELRERGGDLIGAVADYRAASGLAPQDDSIRASWSDALVLLGDEVSARQVVAVPNPSLALLVRQAALAGEAERGALIERTREWLALEAARGDAAHLRESALLSLATGAAGEAADAARRNFATQRELTDVRTLARAVVRSRDPQARRELLEWMAVTGYDDRVTRQVLAGHPPG